MELLDLYDENKNLTNLQISRGVKVPKGYYRLVVHICIFNEEGKMLIQKRTPNKKWPNKWDISVGGCVTAGESSKLAAMREVKEETGLDVINGHVVYSYFNEDQKRHDNYFVDIYHFRFDFQLSDVTLNTRESIDCRCVSLDELVAMNNEDEFLHFERIMKALQQKK